MLFSINIYIFLIPVRTVRAPSPLRCAHFSISRRLLGKWFTFMRFHFCSHPIFLHESLANGRPSLNTGWNNKAFKVLKSIVYRLLSLTLHNLCIREMFYACVSVCQQLWGGRTCVRAHLAAHAALCCPRAVLSLSLPKETESGSHGWELPTVEQSQRELTEFLSSHQGFTGRDKV